MVLFYQSLHRFPHPGKKKIRMSTLLVTGTGGGVGQSILKALRTYDCRLIAADSDPLAAGLYWQPTDRRAIIPPAADPSYVPALLELCQKQRVSLLFPGLDAELPPLSKAKEAFAAIGARVVVSSPPVIEIADDKLLTAVFISEIGPYAPQTRPVTDTPRFIGPCVLKPQRGGARSRNTFLCHTGQDFVRALRDVDPDNCVVQDYIDGPEYTCGTVTLDGHVYGPILMRRILRDGDTYKAFPEHRPELAAVVREIVNSLRPEGPCNVQLRVQDGSPYVLDINARCSGTTAARALCGFNEPKMCADYYLYRQQPPPLSIRTDYTILRYWQETVVPNDDIDAVRESLL